MNEENISNEQQQQSEPAEVSIGLIGGGDCIEAVFADGRHRIPDYVVSYFGRENLEKIAAKLINTSFGDFLSGIHTKLEKDRLNQIQQNLINNHFGNL